MRRRRDWRARRATVALRSLCGRNVRRAFVSGFAGIVRIEPSRESAEADRVAIARMAGAIAFRGPDALQEIHQLAASFAFSLLKTGPPPQESSQPCTIHSETCCLCDARSDGR